MNCKKKIKYKIGECQPYPFDIFYKEWKSSFSAKQKRLIANLIKSGATINPVEFRMHDEQTAFYRGYDNEVTIRIFGGDYEGDIVLKFNRRFKKAKLFKKPKHQQPNSRHKKPSPNP